MGRRRSRGRWLALLLILAAAGAAYALWMPQPALPPVATSEGTLRVHYVDVGQGDGTIWELPDGGIVVYDCGPPAASAEENAMVRYLRDALRRPEGTRLAALIASHGHLDHVGGCEEILAAYDFERLYDTGYDGTDAPASYQRFRAQLAAEGAPLHTLADAAAGATLPFASVRATILWPRAFAPGGWDAIAEASYVTRVEHGSTAFCFQGDIEDRQEAQIAALYPGTRCDVYLVGHHGSRYASSAAWLREMRPSIAVASYGSNPYGHPHTDTLCRIQAAGVALYETPGSRALVVASDGASVRVSGGAARGATACGP